MTPALQRIARRMCRIYFQGMSIKRKESEAEYVEREWPHFVPMATAALEELAAMLREMGRERVNR